MMLSFLSEVLSQILIFFTRFSILRNIVEILECVIVNEYVYCCIALVTKAAKA